MTNTLPPTAGLRRWMSAWPTWTGIAAIAWSAAYAVAGALWWRGVSWYPFAAVRDDRSTASIVEGASASVVGPAFVAAGVLGVLSGLILQRAEPRSRIFAVASVVAAGLAVTATCLLPDYTALALLAMWPAFVVFAFTGIPGAQDGLGDILYWHRDNLLLIMLGGLLWTAVAVGAWRRRRAQCVHCGRGAADRIGPDESRLLRRGRRWVWLAVLATVPYDFTRVVWALGWPLGLSRSTYDSFKDPAFMLYLGLILAALSTGGALLTHGLVARWGERFPRWIPHWRGRRVPPALAVGPATAVTVSLPPTALMSLNRRVNDDFSLVNWGTWLPSTFMLLWAVALAGATWCYHRRRRGPCRHCRRTDRPSTVDNQIRGCQAATNVGSTSAV